MRGQVRANTGVPNRYVPQGKMQRRCPKCEAAPGWHCTAPPRGENLIGRTLLRFHPER